MPPTSPQAPFIAHDYRGIPTQNQPQQLYKTLVAPVPQRRTKCSIPEVSRFPPQKGHLLSKTKGGNHGQVMFQTGCDLNRNARLPPQSWVAIQFATFEISPEHGFRPPLALFSGLRPVCMSKVDAWPKNGISPAFPNTHAGFVLPWHPKSTTQEFK